MVALTCRATLDIRPNPQKDSRAEAVAGICQKSNGRTKIASLCESLDSIAKLTKQRENKSFTEVTGDTAAQNELNISLQQMGYLLCLNRALVLEQK